MIAGAVGASREALGYNTHFLYPDDGGGIEGLARASEPSPWRWSTSVRSNNGSKLAKRRLTARIRRADRLRRQCDAACERGRHLRTRRRAPSRCSGACSLLRSRRSAISMCWRRARTTTERVAGMARGSPIGSIPRASVPVLSGRLLLGGRAKDDKQGDTPGFLR